MNPDIGLLVVEFALFKLLCRFSVLRQSFCSVTILTSQILMLCLWPVWVPGAVAIE